MLTPPLLLAAKTSTAIASSAFADRSRWLPGCIETLARLRSELLALCADLLMDAHYIHAVCQYFALCAPCIVRKMLLALAAVYCGIDIVFDIVTPIKNYFTEEP